VFERFQEIYRLPRAVHLDHEIMRVLQSIDLADVVAKDLVGVDDYQWFGADGELLLRFDRHGLAPSGWEGSYMFFQPELEAAIHRHACVPAGVTVERGWVTDGLKESGDHVDLTLHQVGENEPGQLARTGECRTVRALWVVGADGANSFVRAATGIGRRDLGFQ
jgi:2-polyprenyl-6-methoxyphenol hydroxylase-like FAD-dependent oxidoreductase